MTAETAIFLLVSSAIVAFGLWHSWHTTVRHERRERAVLDRSRRYGLDAPPSLHPVIDTAVCIGSRACVAACPEQDVLGLIAGRGTLVAGANCIGHGRCAAACPVDAIDLVFGTEVRGVELPDVSGSFESSVPGMYIAGELGGMGLIANAFEQAIQAMDAIADDLRGERRNGDDDVRDVVIVGSGPAGLAASLRARERGLDLLCIEQGHWGGAVRTYPRAKIIMTRPVRVPLYGPVKLRTPTKEALLALWDDILSHTGVTVQTETRLTGATVRDGVFDIETTAGPLRARRVLLAIGRRGTPRPLGVPGGDGVNVTSHLLEPERWAGKRLAVVGGGDVACETALTLAELPETSVTLVYRGAHLARPKAALRERVERAAGDGSLTVRLATEVTRVASDALHVRSPGGEESALPVDQVFACLGGMPPGDLLRSLGIRVVTKYGEA